MDKVKRDALISSQEDLYGESLSTFGDAAGATRNGSIQIMHARFKGLMDGLRSYSDQRPITIHDVGSGLSDLYPYLKKNYSGDFTYSGTEINGAMVQMAQKKYPELTIFQQDIFESTKRYDYLVLSGVFNIPGKTTKSDWNIFVFQMITKMYELANAGIVFNFLTNYKTTHDSAHCYFNPETIYGFCQQLSRFVNLNHTLPLYEVTCTVYKPTFIQQLHAATDFEKYFK
jgi:hypothetical protein